MARAVAIRSIVVNPVSGEVTVNITAGTPPLPLEASGSFSFSSLATLEEDALDVVNSLPTHTLLLILLAFAGAQPNFTGSLNLLVNKELKLDLEAAQQLKVS